MNAIETMFMKSATPDRECVLFVNKEVNSSVWEVVRLLSNNPTSNIKEFVTIKGHGVHEFVGFPYDRESDVFHVMERLEKNMNVTELERNVDSNEYEKA